MNAAAHRAALVALYSPGTVELAQSLPNIAAGIGTSLELLRHGQNLALIAQAQAQAKGLDNYLSRLREALLREQRA